jgi:hypothetical protein
MDVREKLVELFYENNVRCDQKIEGLVDDVIYIIDHGVTVQECAYWQYIEDDIDEDNNIQAYCSVCGAGDKHATSMIGKVPYCWKCGRKMMPHPPKGE